MITLQLPLGRFAKIIQTPDELPNLLHAQRLYLDVETNSFTKECGGLYPYLNHRVAGIAVTVDNSNYAWYAAIRHSNDRWNLPLDNVLRWAKDLLRQVPRWINHNVKFDAHFMAVDGCEFGGTLEDTLALAKLLDSDRIGHGLKVLAKEWLHQDISESAKVEAYLKGIKSKNYADVSGDILGKYACRDVLLARDLHEYILSKLPAEVSYVRDMELKLTPALFDMEREGMQVNVEEVQRKRLTLLRKIIDQEERIAALTEREYTDSASCNYDILCNRLGLPVLGYTEDMQPDFGEKLHEEERRPSFKGNILDQYLAHPDVLANPAKQEVVKLIAEHRDDVHFKGLFLEVLTEHGSSGVVRPSYNQVVRTGRMSCSKPNAQQFETRAKELIICKPGEGILGADASQIEFRFIAHYIQDANMIAAYNANKRVDFHQFTADDIGITRSPAKTMNFALGFGAGERRTVQQLAYNPDIVKAINEKIVAEIEAGQLDPSKRDEKFRRLCEAKGKEVYQNYHQRFPNMKATARMAANNCAVRGYVFNSYGRRRHLPQRAIHKAFNAAVQGSAGDYVKSRMVALAPRYNARMRELGLRPFVQVHDFLGWYGPLEVTRNPDVWRWLSAELEIQAPAKLRVPFAWDFCLSHTTWAAAHEKKAQKDEQGRIISGSVPSAVIDEPTKVTV